ncbi:MAG: putative metal-binding motif-containing protein [Deltaproteobacteria bacterium]|nr:putative metal-binding motif-containing protein [Deltaproteobacteria bacterium]
MHALVRSMAVTVVLFLSAPPAAARAATILVDSTLDDLDQGPNGNCTLREAVLSANDDVAVDGCTAGAGADAIVLPRGSFTLTIPGRDEDAGQTGDLDVIGALTIRGAGSSTTFLEAGSDAVSAVDRVLHVQPTAVVTLEDLTVRHGHALAETVSNRGGAIALEQGSLTARHIAVRESLCEATQWFVGCGGGGIASDGGTLVVEESVVEGNRSDGSGGGIRANEGVTTLVRTVVRANHAQGTGGGLSLSGQSSIDRSAVVDNAVGYPPCPPFVCQPSGSSGGGISNAGTLEISNSTLARNRSSHGVVSAGRGGGITNFGALTLADSTLVGNLITASLTPPYAEPIGVENDDVASAMLRNNVLDDTCRGGGFTSLGWNIERPAACGLGEPRDLPATDPILSPAVVFASGTALVPVQLGSPAIDSGDPAQCPTLDQTGSARPADGDGDQLAICDRGAVEMPFGPDGDGDGWVDAYDLCPADPDPDQADRDGDGLGDACDPCTDEDADGYGDPGSAACTHPEPDCDDGRDGVNPGETEVLGNGRDDDCEPATLDCPDADGDGWSPLDSPSCAGDIDCNDANAAVHPGAAEVPGNGVDDDCDAATPAGCFGPGPQSAVAAGLGPPERAGGAGPSGFALACLVLLARNLSRARRPGRRIR